MILPFPSFPKNGNIFEKKEKHIMKKLMALSLALLMTLSLVACGSKTEQPA